MRFCDGNKLGMVVGCDDGKMGCNEDNIVGENDGLVGCEDGLSVGLIVGEFVSEHCVQALHRTDAHLTSQDAGLVKQNSGQLESVEVVVG